MADFLVKPNIARQFGSNSLDKLAHAVAEGDKNRFGHIGGRSWHGGILKTVNQAAVFFFHLQVVGESRLHAEGFGVAHVNSRQ